MKLIIDGIEYELDSDVFVDAWYRQTLPYVDPSQEQAKKYTDVRLAAKALLRVRLGSVLKMFATIFHVDDWRDLAPKRGEDILVKLHGYIALLMRAEGQTARLEMESEASDDSTGIVGHHASRRLTLTSARFDGGPTLYTRAGIEREDTGRTVGDGARQAIAAPGPSASGGGLEPISDAPEI